MMISRLLLLFIVVVTSGNVAEAQITPDNHGAPAVRSAIDRWCSKASTFRRGRPTILLATSTQQCAGCCATAINEITRAIDSYGLEANVLVVIGTTSVGEGLAIRDKFIAENVVEDSRNILSTVFHAGESYPDLFVVEPNGGLAAHITDVQHNNAIPYATFIRAHVRPAPIRKKVANSRSVPIREPKKKLSEAQSVGLDEQSGVLSLLEPHQNAVYRFHLKTGKIESELSGFDSLKFRFRKPHDDPRGWNVTDSLYAPMVPLEAFVRTNSGKPLFIAAGVFTGYLRVDSQPGKAPYFMMRKGRAIISVRGVTVEAVRLLPEISGIQVADPLMLRDGRLVTLLLDENIAAHRPVVRDTACAIGVFDNALTSGFCAIKLKTLDSVLGHPFNPLVVGALTWAGDSSFFYVSEGNRTVMRIDLHKNGTSVDIVEPAGTLQQLFYAKRVGDSTVSDSVSVLDATSDSSGLYILLSDPRGKNLKDQLIVQRYALNGLFLSETRVRSRNDEIIAAAFAGVGKSGPVILAKWAKARWTIEGLGL